MKNKNLDAHTKALLEEKAFRQKHKKVFEQLESIQFNISETEKALKDDVKTNVKMSIANEFITVTYSPVHKQFYNFDIIMDKTTPKMKKALEVAKAITHTLDKKIFEGLVDKGIIPVEIKQAAFEETELAPRVSIKEQKPE